MNYFIIKLNNTKALYDEIMKIDPLFNIKRQIENNEYKLKKRGYSYPVYICGLEIKKYDHFSEKSHRIKLIEKSISYIKNSHSLYIHKTVKGWYSFDLHLESLYKIWVKI
jgi:hypothetical protein